MSVTKVSNYIISPGTNKGKHPATMGSSWTCNMYREKNEENEYLESVPGLEFVHKFVGPARCRGAYVSSVGLGTDNQQENAFVVFGKTLWRLDWHGGYTELGTVASGQNRVTFAETGGVNPYLLIADGSNLWAYNLIEGGELKRVTLPERVTGDGGQIAPSHVACIAGSICINDRTSGFIYYSIPYPLNNDEREVFVTELVDGKMQPVYDPDNAYKILTKKVDAFEYMFYDAYGTQQFFNAESSSDNVRAIAAVGSNLYLFGTKTIEIWQRGSGEYETWMRQSYTTNASNGLQAPYSIATCGSNLYYLGSGESYAKGVLMVSGQTYEKISETWLDDKLLGETGDTAFAFAYAQGNHNFYVLQLGNAKETWVYDLGTREWAQRTSRVLDSGDETRWRPSAMLWFRGQFYAFCNDGCQYGFSDNYYWEDYGSHDKRLPVIRHRQGAVVVNEEKPFIFQELAIECSVGAWDDYTLQPEILLEVSKDGGNTFGHVRSCKLGKTGNYSHRVRFHSLGYNRLCVLRVTYSHPTALELTACSQRITPTNAII
jgi:hypothetical protein